MNTSPIIRHLGYIDYTTVWQKMQVFTDMRDANTPDEIWFVEHPPVFTQGLAGKPEHVLNPGDIPIIQTDRGGQVTYHGPGQVVVYVLLDLRRLNMGIRQLVCTLEKCIIHVLSDYGITATNRKDAPGVYINGAKICSIGLRVRRGCSYHGIAFNIDMDLTPFSRINPCGFRNLAITQLREWIYPVDIAQVQTKISTYFKENFSYNSSCRRSELCSGSL